MVSLYNSQAVGCCGSATTALGRILPAISLVIIILIYMTTAITSVIAAKAAMIAAIPSVIAAIIEEIAAIGAVIAAIVEEIAAIGTVIAAITAVTAAVIPVSAAIAAVSAVITAAIAANGRVIAEKWLEMTDSSPTAGVAATGITIRHTPHGEISATEQTTALIDEIFLAKN